MDDDAKVWPPEYVICHMQCQCQGQSDWSQNRAGKGSAAQAPGSSNDRMAVTSPEVFKVRCHAFFQYCFNMRHPHSISKIDVLGSIRYHSLQEIGDKGFLRQPDCFWIRYAEALEGRSFQAYRVQH